MNGKTSNSKKFLRCLGKPKAITMKAKNVLQTGNTAHFTNRC